MNSARLCVGAAMAWSLLTPAYAQERRSIAALLADGYEIKSTLFVPLESAKQLNVQNESSSVVLSLQKGQSIGVCFITLASYLSLPKQFIDEGQACAVR